jgi:hypothetical protein
MCGHIKQKSDTVGLLRKGSDFAKRIENRSVLRNVASKTIYGKMY